MEATTIDQTAPGAEVTAVGFAHGEPPKMKKARMAFDPATEDVVCERRKFKLVANVPQELVHHSPDGFEIGYGGSGPADFALNILHYFLPPTGQGDMTMISPGRGTCSGTAYALYHEFKFEFLAAMPYDGGTIPGNTIREWIAGRLAFHGIPGKLRPKPGTD